MTWDEVASLLEAAAPGTTWRTSKGAIDPPSSAGAVRAAGLPRGELAGWRFPPTVTCLGLHVHEYPGEYVAHLDRVHPACDLPEHLMVDAPELIFAAVAGGAVGLVLAGRRHRVAGATVGALVGAVVAGVAGGGRR